MNTASATVSRTIRTDSPFRNDFQHRLTYRSKLVKLTRRAFLAYDRAKSSAVEVDCALRYDADDCEIAHRRLRTAIDRYNFLTGYLAEEALVSADAIHRQVSVEWPICRSLMANL